MNSNAENDLAPTMRMLLGELLDDPRLYRRAHHGSERQARGLCPRERYRQPPGHHSGPSDIPRLRHRSAHFTPASHCCKIPMVWSSVRIVRFIARPFHGADSRRDWRKIPSSVQDQTVRHARRLSRDHGFACL